MLECLTIFNLIVILLRNYNAKLAWVIIAIFSFLSLKNKLFVENIFQRVQLLL